MRRAFTRASREQARRRFLDHLAQSRDWREAAEAAGVSERTGRRWYSEAKNRLVRSAQPVLASPTRFVGRRRDIRAVSGRFEAGARLVTLIGAPGMGKTRLAAEILHDPLRDNEIGFFCDLRDARTVHDLCAVVSEALEATLASDAAGSDAIENLGRVLGVREPCLVVLDNFEQLVDDAALAVGRWLRMAPHVRFLVTSRRRLCLEWERTHELRPLSLPDVHGSKDCALTGESVELFLDRATAVDSTFRLEAHSMEDVFALMHRLEGIPLAIELAAGQIAQRSPRQLLDALERDAAALSSAYRDTEARHATLSSAIESSWQLLSHEDQTTLAYLSVFRGGFTSEAAAAVTSHDGCSEPASFEPAAARLREMSLLRGERAGTFRWDLFEVIREFSGQRLRRLGREAEARRAHANYYLAWGERRACEIPSAEGLEARAALGQELDNLRAAFAWWEGEARADVRPALRMSLVVDAAARQRLPRLASDALTGAIVLVEGVAHDAGVWALLAEVRVARAAVSRAMGDHDGAEADLGEARAVCDEGSELEAAIEYEAGMACLLRGRPHPARVHLERALVLASERQNVHLEGRAHSALGWLLAEAFQDPAAFGHHEEAACKLRQAGDAYEEAVARRTWCCHRMFFQRGDGLDELAHLAKQFDAGRAPYDRVFALHNMGVCYHDRGDLESARDLFDGAGKAARRHGFRRCEGIIELCRASVDDEAGALESAAARYAKSVDTLTSVGDLRFEALALTYMGGLTARQGDPERAETLLQRAASFAEVSRDEGFKELVELQKGRVELARSRRARAMGRRDEAESLQKQALDRVASARSPRRTQDDQLVRLPLVRCSDDARLIVRLIELDLENANEGRLQLSVWEHGGSFQFADRSRVELPLGPVIRGTLVLLVRRRLEQPGVSIEAEEILAHVWPGERILAESGSVRVRNTIARLRRAGLDRVLLTDAGGYLLDPEVPLRVIESSSAAAV